MEKKKITRRIIKKVTSEKPSVPNGDFDLNPEYYNQSHVFEVYSTERKITKIFGLQNKNDGQGTEPYLKARTRSKTPRGWRFSYGVDIHGPSHVSRFIRGILSIAKKLGWKISKADDLDQIKSGLRENEETIIRLEKSNQELREKHEELMTAFRQKQEEILYSRVGEFETDLNAFKTLLHPPEGTSISENNLQTFLYDHAWLFGTEYVNARPQVLRGAHSRFDFYLERFNKTNDIIEIKLASETIINRDGTISVHVIQAVDQIIEYMESSQAVAHSSVLSEEEGIKELRPRGIVIIGIDKSSEAQKKLHKWNYQFAHINILTYEDVLNRAESILQHLKNK
jgi:hypothetical protein